MFVESLLQGSGLLTPQLHQFILQDAVGVLGGEQSISSRVGNVLTDLAARIDIIKQGAGFSDADADAHEIVPGLWIGNLRAASSPKWLHDHGITHVLNVGADKVEKLPGINYMRFEIEDDPSSNIAQLFDKAEAFITDALSSGGRILVHCHAGISRSCTIVAMYLVRNAGMKPIEALNFIRKARPIVQPNMGFLHQLAKYGSGKQLVIAKHTRVEGGIVGQAPIPGQVHVGYWTPKENAMYEKVFESYRERGYPIQRAKQAAAATVNAFRARQ